jgi:phosphohistidine phosphatase
MNLYLLRHGIAVNAEAAAADGDRPLTEKGIKRIRKGARGLRRLGVKFDAILTSPLARAQQTAVIIAEGLGREADLSVIEALKPDCSVDHLLAGLEGYHHCKNLLLVGHEPLLSDTAAFLVMGKKNAAVKIVLKKGGLCQIRIESLSPGGSGTLCLLLAPKLLRLLGAWG